MRKVAARAPGCALVICPLLLLFLLTSPVMPQEVTATISGTVTDPSGEVIPGVNVEVTNPETAARNTVFTGARGEYMVPLLRPGRYTLTISHPGSELINAVTSCWR